MHSSGIHPVLRQTCPKILYFSVLRLLFVADGSYVLSSFLGFACWRTVTWDRLERMKAGKRGEKPIWPQDWLPKLR